ncbi:unnamed protein product [Cladocopium goreaui]|uniref:Phospholipid scramblase 3 (PL scramblase 3) (Ca(2+)-dependent phospholipid scramblase 3) n=1 Tax=Cladocopium goreaui TaxID=2562237 RepID=A0A9P1D4X2_9DINO|nr:unnamed protein product [Cladocopium goreaui]
MPARLAHHSEALASEARWTEVFVLEYFGGRCEECRQDVPYVGEDPGYRGDNLVYLCRSLSLTPLRHQQDRPAEDSGLRCAERNNYTITFAEPEPWQSQVMKSNIRNFSRSSFKTSIQSVKQSSQMRLPRGRRSDTETESEFSILRIHGGGLPGEEREGKKKPRSRYVRRAHGSYAVLPRQAYEADLRMLPQDGYTDPLTLENWWHKGVTWGSLTPETQGNRRQKKKLGQRSGRPVYVPWKERRRPKQPAIRVKKVTMDLGGVGLIVLQEVYIPSRNAKDPAPPKVSGVAPGQTMEVTLPGKHNSGPNMQQVMTGLVPGCAANNDAPFLYLDRPFAIDCCCLNRPKVDVFDVRGTATVKLGIISDPFAWMDMTFGIHIGPNAQESDPPALIARGAACQPGAVCKLCGVCCGRTCREAYLEVVDPNDKDRTVAFITKGWAGGAQEIFTSANSFYVDFGEVKDPACKALLLATALFLNYRFFEGRAGSTQSSSN